MTEAEAKVIEWRNGVGVPYRLLSEPMGGFISGTPRVATPADLAAAGYLPASRLLAVEAELATERGRTAELEARLGDFIEKSPDFLHLEEAAAILREDWLACEETVEQRNWRVKRQGLWYDRDQAAPPSPPSPNKTACYCSDRMSGGLPCPPGKCPNVPCHCWPYNRKGELEHDSTCPSRGEPPVATEPSPDPRLAHALANPPGPRHARLIGQEREEEIGEFPTRFAGRVGELLAKETQEAAPVAKVEAPSEPAGWVPKVGDPVRVTDGELSGQLGTIIDQDTGRTWPYGVVFVGDYIRRFAAESLEHAPRSVDTSNQLAAQACPFWEEPPGLTEEELGRYYPAEPAPQPPATTGGDRLAGSPHIVDCFSVELGCTIRDCLDCGCLVPGGPTRCKRCANEVKS